MKELSAKHILFCHEYVIDNNATRAAIAAGYSERSAGTTGSRLLKDADIKKLIDELRGKRLEELKIDADYVLKRHVEIDRLDIIDILEPDLTIKDLADWPKSWRISICGIEILEYIGEDIQTVIKKIKWPDKVKNLKSLGEHTDIRAYLKEKDGDSDTNSVLADLFEAISGSRNSKAGFVDE